MKKYKKTLFDPDLTFEEAEELIRNGVNLNEKSSHGGTPLFFVKDIKIAKLLINNGADVNHLTFRRDTCLHYTDNISIAQLFIQYGVDVNHKNDSGNTPLHFQHNSVEMVKLFFENGADLNIINKYGKTPLDFMCDTKVNSYLINIGGIAGDIETYKLYHDLFSKEQQKAFDAFLLLTNYDYQFFQMCLSYQNDQKNKVQIEIKEMDIV